MNVVKKKKDILQVLQEQVVQIEAALPRNLMDAKRMIRIAQTEIRLKPALAHCDPISFLGALVRCSQLGLTPGSDLGQAYLVPFKNKDKGITEANLLIGYKGLLSLAHRSPFLNFFEAMVVREGDEFDFQYGTQRFVHFKPGKGKRGDLTHVYALAGLKNAGDEFEVMSRFDLDDYRRRYTRSDSDFWRNHYEAMCRKTIIRQVCRILPLTSELQLAMSLDNKEESDNSQENAQVILDIVPGMGQGEEKEVSSEVFPKEEDNSLDSLNKAFASSPAPKGEGEKLKKKRGPQKKVGDQPVHYVERLLDLPGIPVHTKSRLEQLRIRDLRDGDEELIKDAASEAVKEGKMDKLDYLIQNRPEIHH